ncbi:MAG TPA: peptide chain release factor N(5)-glutamine methyltransferase [Clostridia bacterium]|nr:peptide chain release factor N(5)-glutamine methyltransferase [Clostridia bacterium]
MKAAKKTVRETLASLSTALVPVAKEEAAQQARLLVCHALRVPESGLLALYASPMPETAKIALQAYAARRQSGEPLQYILGQWEFMGLPFYVENGVLIPRQDTEALAEHALKLIRERGYKTALDLCCGTGCLGISLAKLSGVSATLADISPLCIMLAEKNAARNGIAAKIAQGDLFSAVSERFDVIVTNPPYINTDALDTLQKEVRYEPRLALDGGKDGLMFYRRIAKEYKAYLAPGGALLMEVGAEQASDVINLFESAYTVKDLCGIDRVVVMNG